ncbi:phosphoinositide-interacting protein-like [Astyanax mexicanus]|uniref:Phosphoinositide interacting regulator of transient receptor potential channels n=2 Tax=Astyanax mexicanus TaxID=7994 RepID=A0A3B1JKF1_ASTMX|nr:phosphoinositide-interacting protein-like [Astyanax mexicanus]
MTMTSPPENIPLGEHPLSPEQLTPYTESTIFSLSRSESMWPSSATRSSCEFYRHAVLLMTTGGSVLACGMVLSGLFFAGVSVRATKLLGPAVLSIGLVVLVVGVVLVPITREMKQLSSFKRTYSLYKPQYQV